MTILITGASSGIGKAIATAAVAAGHTVILVARSEGSLQAAATELGPRASIIVADITKALDIIRIHQTVIERFGGIDVIVNNAGIAPSLKLEDTTDDIWTNTFATNVDAAFRIIRSFVPQLKASKTPHIINIASSAAFEGFAYTAAYTASKHALLGLSRAIAKELARNNISVTTICPGFVRTAILEAGIENIMKKTGKSAAEAEAQLGAMNKFGKIIEPQEVASAVLASLNEPLDPSGREVSL